MIELYHSMYHDTECKDKVAKALQAFTLLYTHYYNVFKPSSASFVNSIKTGTSDASV